MAAVQDMQDMNMETALNVFFDNKYSGIVANTFDGSKTFPASSNDKRRAYSSWVPAYRKGCIRRNGACDNRPGDCCFSSSCRCNLWGSNCRCQRMGLFQKWG
ncbi:uncharacterized protein LOC116806085 [Drosophila grimshawi]|uniref:uncharacterized protein LOC116806085 n=1 Tax=Drosophila grimshawi TaxID=7222 RepID=UPI000C86ED26|nr:uncharacterized protein LOC116806085 [Drosophila grimshawi]